MTEDEMVGRHHPPNGHEFEQNPGDSVGQGNFGAAVDWVAKSWLFPSGSQSIRASASASDLQVYIKG